MKKFTVAVLIIGMFVLYSIFYHADPVALVPTKVSSSSSTSTSGSTQTPSGTTNTPGITSSTQGALYKDGSYTGSVADAQWGNIQVRATVQGGKLTNVQFLQYPNDRNRSIEINTYADPQLASEAIQAQSANVDVVSGATDSSDAFIQSLTDALSQAKI
ncbi:MAG: hypothetical protein PVS3B3_27220 [Ktedonobacteraceae bacterium]